MCRRHGRLCRILSRSHKVYSKDSVVVILGFTFSSPKNADGVHVFFTQSFVHSGTQCCPLLRPACAASCSWRHCEKTRYQHGKTSCCAWPREQADFLIHGGEQVGDFSYRPCVSAARGRPGRHNTAFRKIPPVLCVEQHLPFMNTPFSSTAAQDKDTRICSGPPPI